MVLEPSQKSNIIIFTAVKTSNLTYDLSTFFDI
jgi:hypothetical protein